MSTDASLTIPSAAIALPPPKVGLIRGSDAAVPASYLVNPTDVALGTPINTLWDTLAIATAVGIPDALLAAEYDLRLELLRYRPTTRGRQNQRRAGAGWVHPSNGPGASGDNTRYHGGQHSDVNAVVQAIRLTELPVVTHGQRIDLTQMIAGFMQLITCRYWVYDGASSATQALLQVCTPLSRRGNNGGTRFPYFSEFSPGYFRFRYSVKDPLDSRNNRIYGPASQVIAASHPAHPFRTDFIRSAQVGRAVAFDVATNPEPHSPGSMSLWVSTRLP